MAKTQRCLQWLDGFTTPQVLLSGTFGLWPTGKCSFVFTNFRIGIVSWAQSSLISRLPMLPLPKML